MRITGFLIGYDTGPGFSSFPTLPEVLVTVGTFALEGLGYRLENPVMDSLRLARRGLPGLRRYGLDALSEVLELPRRTCHRALEDVERTLAVVHEVYYMLTSGRPRTLWELGR